MRGAGVVHGTEGVRRFARDVIGKLPSVQVGMRATDAGLDEAVVRGALEFALRLGEAMLALGAGAADVTAAVRRAARESRLRPARARHAVRP